MISKLQYYMYIAFITLLTSEVALQRADYRIFDYEPQIIY